jgi:hypothetical protein
LARIVDAERNCGNAQRIVEGRESIEWHDTGSSVAFSLGGRFGKLGRYSNLLS